MQRTSALVASALRILLGGWVLAGSIVLASCGPTPTPSPTPVTAVEATLPPDTEEAPAAVPEGTAAVALVCEAERVPVGETTEVLVTADGVTDLYGIEVHLAYNPAYLEVIDAYDELEGVQVQDGDLLEVGFVALNEADNDAGTVAYAVSQMPPSVGVEGSGVLVSVQFRAKAAGEGGVVLQNVLLATAAGQPVPLEVINDELSVRIE
ncbi:MAG: cohesin domain-containing protein [Anaerolineae bacterium]